MAENKYNVPQISAETLAAIRRKSAYNLPDRPSERGIKPDEIKRAIAGPVTDTENSAIAELMRVIGDINRVLKLIETEGSGVSITQISGGKRLTVTTEEGESHIDIVDRYSNEEIDKKLGEVLPPITEADEGKIVRVSGDKYALEPIPEGDISIEDCTLDVSLNTSTYVMTVALKNKDGKVVTQDTVDFPLESVVTNVKEENGIITITLQNGTTASYDITDLVDGLVSQAKHDQDIARIEAALGSYITDIDALVGGD